MGSPSNESNSLIVNMKYLAVIAIALFGAAFVAAEPEAEAAAHYYGHYGYGHGYAYAPYAPYYAVPAASSYQHVSTPAATHGISQIHKREAEADPAVLYGAYYPGVAHHGLGATSYTHRSPQGLSGYYPYRFGYGRYYGYYGYPYLY